MDCRISVENQHVQAAGISLLPESFGSDPDRELWSTFSGSGILLRIEVPVKGSASVEGLIGMISLPY